MKYIISILRGPLLITAIATLLSACTKNIHLNLTKTSDTYVIQGEITNQANYCQVLISQDENVNDDNAVTYIDGATVTITDSGGQTVILPQTDTGVYRSSAMTGVPGHTYRLSVTISGKTFTASSTMPVPVNLDSIYLSNNNTLGSSDKTAHALYRDPAGKGNSYRFVEYVAGFQQAGIYVQNDDLDDGQSVDAELSNFSSGTNNNTNNRKIQSGDSVSVDMQCIDAAVYTYFFSLNQSGTGSGTATPADPVSNITGGALGYFSAHTTQKKTILVP